MFADNGLFVPVQDCECIIDTGGAQHISVSAINYGLRETLMRKCIAALCELGQIDPIIDVGWLFKAPLAPEPHQEHIVGICDLVWRFCQLYSTECCDKSCCLPHSTLQQCYQIVFRNRLFKWLFDAPHGYHQICVSPCSKQKLAFAGPNATKWTIIRYPLVLSAGRRCLLLSSTTWILLGKIGQYQRTDNRQQYQHKNHSQQHSELVQQIENCIVVH